MSRKPKTGSRAAVVPPEIDAATAIKRLGGADAAPMAIASATGHITSGSAVKQWVSRGSIPLPWLRPIASTLGEPVERLMPLPHKPVRVAA